MRRAGETLALHELATNAAKYGALASPVGKLEIRWTFEQGPIVLEWRERGVTVVQEKVGRGYGRELIEVVLPLALGARTRFDLDREGVHCTIELPSLPLHQREPGPLLKRPTERASERPPAQFFPRAGHTPWWRFWGPCAKKGGGGSFVRSLCRSLSGPTFFARAGVRAHLPAPLHRDGFPSGNPRRGSAAASAAADGTTSLGERKNRSQRSDIIEVFTVLR
jgi:hypothetical protein